MQQEPKSKWTEWQWKQNINQKTPDNYQKLRALKQQWNQKESTQIQEHSKDHDTKIEKQFLV